MLPALPSMLRRSMCARFGLALALASPLALAQSPAASLRLEEQQVTGSPVRRAQVVVDYPVPYRRVAAKLLDFNGYPVFLHRFRSARVIHRNRAETDVYFEVDLPESLGRFWFLHRMTVTRRSDRLLIEGVSRDGNAGHVETRVELLRTGENSCRFSFSLYALPTVPAHPDSVSRLLRRAVADGAQSLLRVSESP